MVELQKDRHERRLTTMLYIGTMVVMLILLYATYRNIRQYARTVKEVRSHNLAILELEGFLSSLRDAETGVRGYQLTNDSTFLEPYRLANRRLYDHTARIGFLVPRLLMVRPFPGCALFPPIWRPAGVPWPTTMGNRWCVRHHWPTTFAKPKP